MLRLQPDERLVALMREGHDRAFEVLFNRYQSRLLAFCRHLVGSPQDAEDVLQEVFVAAHAAILADSRPINARPWLYRIARNRCLNHLRKPTADGVDSMDVHVHENGTSTLERVQRREELRAIVSDVHELPETQRTALVLREIDDLSYTDIAQAMGTTLPSVKSLLVRARMSLAESSEARILTCDEVRLELAEAAEGLRKLAGSTRRHVRDCPSCSRYRGELRSSTKALAALAPFGLLALLREADPRQARRQLRRRRHRRHRRLGWLGRQRGGHRRRRRRHGRQRRSGGKLRHDARRRRHRGEHRRHRHRRRPGRQGCRRHGDRRPDHGRSRERRRDQPRCAARPTAPAVSAAAIGNPGAFVAESPLPPEIPVVAEAPPAPGRGGRPRPSSRRL